MSAETFRPVAKGPAAREIALLMSEVRKAEDAAIAQGFADCEALVSAGSLALAEKEDEKAGKAKAIWLASARTDLEALEEQVEHEIRAACLREMSLAVSLGQFRTAECNEKAIVAAHREAAGFNPSKAEGEARMKALTPAKRKKIATKAARARWAAKKGE